MQEIMELAMLHAKQMQMLQLQHMYVLRLYVECCLFLWMFTVHDCLFDELSRYVGRNLTSSWCSMARRSQRQQTHKQNPTVSHHYFTQLLSQQTEGEAKVVEVIVKVPIEVPVEVEKHIEAVKPPSKTVSSQVWQ
jgi:hypothetical protein